MSGIKSLPLRFRKKVVVTFMLFLCGTLLATASLGQTVGTNAAQAGGDGTTPQRLTPGQTAERELKGGEAHSYIISLRPGEFLRVLVEQRGINVVVTLRGHTGVKLFEVNLLLETGPEPVSYEAIQGGDYTLDVRPLNARASAGRYSIVCAVNPRATAEDRTRLNAERLLTEGYRILHSGGKTDRRDALAKTVQSLTLWRQLGDRYWTAYSLSQLGLIYDYLGERQKALAFYKDALSIRRAIGDSRGVSAALQNIGNIYSTFLAEPRKALEYFNEALTASESAGDPLAEADVLNDIGWTYVLLIERDKSLDYFMRALSLYEANGGLGERANTLINVGSVYWDMGESEKALGYFEQALAHGRMFGDRQQEANALVRIGYSHYRLGERQKAFDSYHQALQVLMVLQRSTESDSKVQASSLTVIGYIYNELGDWQKGVGYYQRAMALSRASGSDEASTLKAMGDLFYERDKKRALTYYLQALPLQQVAGDVQSRRVTLRNIGYLYLDLSQYRSGLEFFDRALDLSRAMGSRIAEADALIDIGNALNRQDKLAEARASYEQALQISRETKYTIAEAAALTNIGLVHYKMGDERQALDYYGRALPLARETKDRKGEADTLINMGLIYAGLGEQQKALDNYQRSLALRQEIGDLNREADTLVNIGISYRAIDDKGKALESFEEALKIRREVGDKGGEANALRNLGETYFFLGQIDKTREHYQRALPLLKAVGDREGEADMLFRLGASELLRDNPRQGLMYFGRALSIARADGNSLMEAGVLLYSGMTHWQLKDRETANAHFRRALSLFKAEQSAFGQAWTLLMIGGLYEDSGKLNSALDYYNQSVKYLKSASRPGLEAVVLKSIGDTYAANGRRAEALDAYSRSLAVLHEAQNTSGEAFVLVAIGKIYEGQGEKEKAAGYYARAASLNLEAAGGASTPLVSERGTYDSLGEHKERRDLLNYYFQSYQSAKATGLAGPEAEALSRAMGTVMDQTPELAIILGKQAIEKYQEVRANPALRLGKNTYLRSFPSTCHDLADLLIEKGRLFEAQQIVTMLKEEEYAEYVRRDGSEATALSQRADLLPEERKLFAEYARIFDQITAIGSRVATLNAKEDTGARLTEAEITERARLNKELTVANEAFGTFLGHIKTEFGQSGRDIVKEIRENRGLQSDLKQWGEGTVALHTFVGPNRYRIILTTPNSQVDGKTEITSAELNRKIMAFRRTLMNPAVDPRPQAHELYDILVKPVEKHLEQANATTLVWELDGALRYLPLPALYDGRQYMVERYRQAIMTHASLPRLSAEFRGEWRGLGLGVSAQWGDFSALPAVVGELGSIIRDESPPCAPGASKESVVGVMPGRCLVDKDFTAQSFADALRHKYSLVHIASHFSFSPTGADKSFLLLGDGSRLTLKTLDSGAQYDLGGVELLTLSACNTGMDERSEGSEVENFGYIAQNRGAKAVIATLWEVGDESTRALMHEFYRIHSTTPDITKAEALRRAQLALLNGSSATATAEASTPRAELAGLDTSKGNAPPFHKNPERPYAHPYYWAPFILIGNWR
jgi:CHAT domain-containing protein/Tfp pilus assembly protein PilF